MNNKIFQRIERIFLQEGITIDDIIRYFSSKDRHKPDEDTSNERSCGTCIYTHCHPRDYPCCECNPHTMDRWTGLKMFGVEFGADGPREEIKRYDDRR